MEKALTEEEWANQIPPEGRVLSEHCVGKVLWHTVADGRGGSTQRCIMADAVQCGRVDLTTPRGM